MSLPAGPSGNGQKSSTGDLTVTPTSQLHTETIEFSGGATQRVVTIATTGLDVGARINILAIFDGATNGISVVVKNSNGTQLTSFTKAGDEPNALFKIESTGYGGLRMVESTIPAFTP